MEPYNPHARTDRLPAGPEPELRAALLARCLDCGRRVFESAGDACLWLEDEPRVEELPEYCPHCEIRRDVLGPPEWGVKTIEPRD
jgi:hypothetical protein